MSNYLTVRLAPWAMDRIARDYLKNPSRMTKSALRASLTNVPDTEFQTVGGYNERAGATLTVREAAATGVTHLEVRFNNDRDVAMIDCATGRVS